MYVEFKERISTMGTGWFPPGVCDTKSSSCRVNGYYKKRPNYQECRITSLSEIACVGFAISDKTYKVPNRCYVYGNIWQQNTHSGIPSKNTLTYTD